MEEQHYTRHNYHHGHGVPLFKQHSPSDKFYIIGQPVRNLVKWLFSEKGFSSKIISISLIKSIGWKRTADVNKEFAECLQEILNSVYFHLKSDSTEYHAEYKKYFLKNKELQLDVILTHALATIPMTEPLDGQLFQIPQQIAGKWQQVEYEIERIQMTHEHFGAPYFAYGLKPKGEHQDQANAHLLFMGTNPLPTATGALHTLVADLMPKHSVGENIYLAGQDLVEPWIINNSRDKSGKIKPVISCGQSLGGSLAVLSHIYNPNLVRAKAINPPCWRHELKTTYRQNLNVTYQRKPIDNPIIVYTNENDPVFKFDTWIPSNSKVYQVSSKPGRKMGYLATHKDCFAAHSADKGLEINLLDIKQERAKSYRFFTSQFRLIAGAICVVPLILIKLVQYTFSKIAEICEKYSSQASTKAKSSVITPASSSDLNTRLDNTSTQSSAQKTSDTAKQPYPQARLWFDISKQHKAHDASVHSVHPSHRTL